MAALVPLLAARSSNGICMTCGPPYYDNYSFFTKEESSRCKVMTFSKNGDLFAWANGTVVKVIAMPKCTLVQEIRKPNAAGLQFSPCNSTLVIYEQYLGSKQGEIPNLTFWDLKTGECYKEFIQKKQTDWKLLWNDDESVCGRLLNNELLFYENNNFESLATKIHVQKVASCTISGTKDPYIIVYVAGGKSQPSYVRLYKYPNIEGTGKALANKSFFKADKVLFNWNQKGTGVLVMTITDVDTTGSSYYGEQNLHYIATNGESCMVGLNAKEAIHAAEWNPNSVEFCVIHGLMPSKATLFNLKCDPIFEFGTGHRNTIFFNPHGNIMALAGFGNLQGGIEFWDAINRKKICNMVAPDTTYFAWCPDGEHILSATTSPRLRVSNGFQIWHYTGSLLHQSKLTNGELYDIRWQPVPPGTYECKPITRVSVPGIEIPKTEAKPAVYRPPAARGRASSFKLHDDVESYVGPKGSLTEVGAVSKKKGKQQNQKNRQTSSVPGLSLGVAEKSCMTEQEKYKKSKSITKKLNQISKLKQQEEEGKVLDKNELAKVQSENELLKELAALKIESS